MLKIGLTGNYGCGKSAVLDAFGRLGALTIDTDKIAAKLLEEKMIIEKIRTIFGDRVLDAKGGILKSKVAEEIFENGGMRKALEEIIHPLVFERIEDELKGKTTGIAVIEAALIFEGGYEKRFDKIITVYTDEETALARLEKAGITRENALRRLRSQMPITEKIKRADYTIDNNGTFEETTMQAGKIYEKIKREAGIG